MVPHARAAASLLSPALINFSRARLFVKTCNNENIFNAIARVARLIGMRTLAISTLYLSQRAYRHINIDAAATTRRGVSSAWLLARCGTLRAAQYLRLRAQTATARQLAARHLLGAGMTSNSSRASSWHQWRWLGIANIYPQQIFARGETSRR
jgi:hypothetical protein